MRINLFFISHAAVAQHTCLASGAARLFMGHGGQELFGKSRQRRVARAQHQQNITRLCRSGHIGQDFLAAGVKVGGYAVIL